MAETLFQSSVLLTQKHVPKDLFLLLVLFALNFNYIAYSRIILVPYSVTMPLDSRLLACNDIVKFPVFPILR